MKFLLATGIYPPDIGGPATYTQGLARALVARGHSVTVIAYGESSDRTEDGFRVVRVARSGGSLVRYVRYTFNVWRLARHVALVYAQGPVSEGVPATLGARLARRPLVMKIVGDYAWEMARQSGESALLDEFLTLRHNGRIGLFERLERWTTRHAARLITPSRYLKRVVETWSVPQEKIEVILNASEQLPTTRGREEERRALQVENNIVILTAVRAVPWKGIAEMIAWWQDVPASHVFVIAGDGPELARWKKQADECGVADRVRFLGRTDRAELARWYAAADAFVLPSGYEGYPNVVAEAAACGVPCLVSDRGGNPETRETFPKLVSVLPYLDRTAWLVALSAVSPRSSVADVSPSLTWTHADMVATTENLLQEVVRPTSLLVSYERSLLDPSSAAHQRVRSFTDQGWRVRALIIGRQGADAGYVSSDISAFSFYGSSVRRIWKTLLTGVREARAACGGVVVSAQDPFAAGIIGYLISRLSGAPLEVQEHGDFFSGEWEGERSTHHAARIMGKWILKRAERVRVVSERVKEHVLVLGVAAEKIEVIPVAHELSAFFARPLTLSLQSPVRLLIPCRFVPQKGLDTALETLERLLAKNISFRAEFVGSGPLEKWLRDEIVRRDLSSSVKVSTWKPLAQLYDDADILLVTSRYEGWARTIVEAMAAGVNVVATEVGCVGSFLRPNVDGLAVPVGDVEGLAEAVQSLVENPSLTERLRLSARARAQELPEQTVLHSQQTNGWRGLLETEQTGPRWDRWLAFFIFSVIVSRAASVILFHNSLLYREWGFFTLWDHWRQGYGYSFARELGCFSAYRSPGYLFFLSALYSIFSPLNTWAQAIVQNLFVVATLFLGYLVGCRLVGKRAALIGSFLMVIYPYTFYHYTQFYHTFLSSFFLLLLLYLVLRLQETKRLIWAVASGAALAGLAYVQGTILPAAPLLVVWLLWRWWPEWKRTALAALLMAVVSVSLIAPWTYRNWRVFHAFVPLTTDLGHALFKANNEIIYALTMRGYPQEIVDEETVSSTNPNYKQYRLPLELEQTLKREGAFRNSVFWTEWHPREPNGNVARCSDLGPVNEVEFNRYWTDKALEWRHQATLGELIRLHLLKLRTFWQPALFPSVKTGAPWSFANSPLKVWLARTFMTLASALVIFGGWLGILLLIRRRDKNVWLPLAVILVYTALHTFFAGYTKYRIPLDHVMALYAGWAIMRITHHASRIMDEKNRK